jgi:hypothetical protein
MIKSEHLFYLIRSLNKAEKRYFKLFVTTSKENNNYLLLFDAIDKQEQYDESSIKEKFHEKTFVNQLHVTKNYLNQLILKSLRNFHGSISKDAEIKDLLRDIEILLKKELFQQCEQVIDKALKLANLYEKWPDVLNLLDIKRRLLLNTKGSSQASQDLKEINDQELNTLLKIEHVSMYWDISANLFSKLPDLPQFLENPYIKDESKADSLQAKTLYHYIWQTIHVVQGNYNKSKGMLEKIIQIWEDQTNQIYEHPASYLTLLNNLVGLCLSSKDYKYAEELVYKIRKMPERYGLKGSNTIAVKAMLQSFNVELEMYRDTNQIKKGIKVVKDVQAYLADSSLIIPASYHILILYQSSYIYYLNGEFDKALPLLNEILSLKASDIRQDIQAFAHLLFLIIHFELKNITLLRYAVESCRRFLKKKRELYNFEKQLLSCFSRLSTISKSEYQYQFIILKETLYEGMTEKEKTNVLDYLNFDEWIEKNLKK